MKVEASSIDQYSDHFWLKFFYVLLVCLPPLAVQYMLIDSVGGAIEFIATTFFIVVIFLIS